jgi:DNA processing protein
MPSPLVKGSFAEHQETQYEHRSVTEQLAFLALSSIRGVGYWTLWHMARAHWRFADFLALDSGDEASATLKKFGARLENKAALEWRTVRELALDRAKKTLSELCNEGIRLIMYGEPEYPRQFRDLSDAPAWIFLRGDPGVLQRCSLSVVGTRNPSPDGLWLAQFVGANLQAWGAPTVSGLAAGIDQSIHEWSLRMQIPTIAVLGTGIFSDYPKGAESLRDRIVRGGGAILTEYLLRESYSAENFVRRNRLQAALGRVLVPVEWAARSGTAHTVRYATTLQRPIAALRLPDWPNDRLILNNGAATVGKIFTIPGDESEFREFVRKALSESKRSEQPHQHDLFESRSP